MENKTIGVIGLLSLLLVSGVIYLNPEQAENSYICLATEEIGIFYGGVSGTGLTAYPYIENRTDYVRCKKDGVNSVWVPLKDYADENGISIIDLIEPENIIDEIDDIINDTDNMTNVINGIAVTVNYNNKTYFCVFTNEIINDSIYSTSKCDRLN